MCVFVCVCIHILNNRDDIEDLLHRLHSKHETNQLFKINNILLHNNYCLPW